MAKPRFTTFNLSWMDPCLSYLPSLRMRSLASYSYGFLGLTSWSQDHRLQTAENPERLSE